MSNRGEHSRGEHTGHCHSSDPAEHSRPNFNYNGAYVTSKRNLLLVLLAALILGGAVFLVVRRRPPRAVAVGELAPRFELPSLAQGPARLRDFHGQVVVLNFWATWCPPCVEETPSLEKFAEQMRPALNLLVLRFGVRRLAAAFPARTPGGPTKSGSKLPHSKRDRAWDRTPRGPTKSGSKLPHSKATAFSNGRRAR